MLDVPGDVNLWDGYNIFTNGFDYLDLQYVLKDGFRFSLP